jgi:nucleoside-diphosphate-sugar epimerase
LKARILITGSSGFVGQNLVNYLQPTSQEIVTPSRIQLQMDAEMTNVETVVHLAGKAHDLKKTSNPKEYYTVNFELTRQLYDAFLKSDAKQFIFISSIKAVADVTSSVLDENTIPNPQTDYGKSKLMAERYIQAQSLPEGKSYYILRPCMIHGPGNKGNLNLLYQFVKRQIPYPLAAFDNKRSFLSVENLCFIIKAIIEKDIYGGVYNVADDEALSTNEVVSILAQSIGKKPSHLKISKSLIKGIAKLGNVLRLPLNEERLSKLTESYVVSNKKIIDAVGMPLPLRAKEGLMGTAKSFT